MSVSPAIMSLSVGTGGRDTHGLWAASRAVALHNRVQGPRELGGGPMPLPYPNDNQGSVYEKKKGHQREEREKQTEYKGEG